MALTTNEMDKRERAGAKRLHALLMVHALERAQAATVKLYGCGGEIALIACRVVAEIKIAIALADEEQN